MAGMKPSRLFTSFKSPRILGGILFDPNKKPPHNSCAAVWLFPQKKKPAGFSFSGDGQDAEFFGGMTPVHPSEAHDVDPLMHSGGVVSLAAGEIA